MQQLGKRITIVGVTASGKTTFARKLGDIIKLPIIFVDSIMWTRGWEYIGDGEVTKKLDHATLGPEWILEGYIVKDSRPFVFERADTIIYLDYSPWIASWRCIIRWLRHRTNPRPELPESPEKFRFKFLELVLINRESRSLHAFLESIPDKSKIIKFSSPKVARLFLCNLQS